jgi:hypothetical protein
VHPLTVPLHPGPASPPNRSVAELPLTVNASVTGLDVPAQSPLVATPVAR